MAGRGPAPNQARRRRNEPARGDWIDLPPLEQPILPPLPKRPRGHGWSARARVTWAAWRTDPVTQMWSPADIAYALDTISLYDVMTPSSASEVRLRMDGLGLTPKGKRDLRWRIGEADDEEPPRRHGPTSSSNRRARLSIVK